MRRAADKLSLLVSVDPFLSRSGELADFVLPAATFVEGQRGQSAARTAMVETQHKSRTEYAIFRDLARALGLGRFFPWVWICVAVILLTGLWIIVYIFGGFANSGTYVHLMFGMGLAMMAIYLFSVWLTGSESFLKSSVLLRVPLLFTSAIVFAWSGPSRSS